MQNFQQGSSVLCKWNLGWKYEIFWWNIIPFPWPSWLYHSMHLSLFEVIFSKIYYLMLTCKLNMCMMNTLFWLLSTHYLWAPKKSQHPNKQTTHLMRGSLWSLMTFMVTSQALRKMPSQPMGPMASTMLWVIRNGTLSGQSNVSPCGNMRSNAVIYLADLQWLVLKFIYFD